MSRNRVLLICSVYLLLKWWYQSASPEGLDFLLYPTSRLVTLAGGGSGAYIEGTGYFHAAGNFVINAGCAGFNFFLFVFLVMSLTVRGTGFRQYVLVPVALMVAWPVAVATNTCRIVSLLWLRGFYPESSPDPLLHQLMGALVYLVVLFGVAVALRALPLPKIPFRAHCA